MPHLSRYVPTGGQIEHITWIQSCTNGSAQMRKLSSVFFHFVGIPGCTGHLSWRLVWKYVHRLAISSAGQESLIDTGCFDRRQQNEVFGAEYLTKYVFIIIPMQRRYAVAVNVSAHPQYVNSTTQEKLKGESNESSFPIQRLIASGFRCSAIEAHRISGSTSSYSGKYSPRRLSFSGGPALVELLAYGLWNRNTCL